MALNNISGEWLSENGVTALREFAASIPQSVNGLNDANLGLWSDFSSVMEEIGPVADDVRTCILLIKRHIEASGQTMIALHTQLNAKADEIEAYLSSKGTANP